VAVHLYGQEINPETYAITFADLLIKGEGDVADNFSWGSTLSQDGFPRAHFDLHAVAGRFPACALRLHALQSAIWQELED